MFPLGSFDRSFESVLIHCSTCRIEVQPSSGLNFNRHQHGSGGRAHAWVNGSWSLVRHIAGPLVPKSIAGCFAAAGGSHAELRSGCEALWLQRLTSSVSWIVVIARPYSGRVCQGGGWLRWAEHEGALVSSCTIIVGSHTTVGTHRCLGGTGAFRSSRGLWLRLRQTLLHYCRLLFRWFLI